MSRVTGGVVAALLLAAPGAAQEVRRNLQELRGDPRLQARVHVDPDRPSLAHLLAAIRDATGVDLAVDQGLADRPHDFGRIQPAKAGYRAWQLLELIAETIPGQGGWTKTATGYRLERSAPPRMSRPSPAPAEAGPLTEPLLIALALLTCLVVVLLLRARRNRGPIAAAGPGHR